MAEAMSEEWLARLSADNEPRGDHLSGLTADEVGELLDEVKRLHDQAAYMREQIEQLAQVNEERKTRETVYRALAEEHQKRGDKLSAQLAETEGTRDALAAATERLDAGAQPETDLAEKMRHQPTGVYRLFWHSGGCSVAAVGMLDDGSRWYAPANWTSQEASGVASADWSPVKSAELIEPYQGSRRKRPRKGVT